MNNEIAVILNKQLNAELFSSYLYLAISSYFNNINLNGFAHWMKLQSEEEIVHAMKLYDYINKRRWEVQLFSIAQPTSNWNSPLCAMQQAFEHEQNITFRINEILELVINLKDYATQSFLQWFVDEQVEEENSVNNILQQLKLIGNDVGSLLILNTDLSSRISK